MGFRPKFHFMGFHPKPLSNFMGFHPKPHFIFFLDKKNEAKKIKTTPASLKKLTFEKLKSSKLLPLVVKQEYFCAFLACFLVHRMRSKKEKIRNNCIMHAPFPSAQGILPRLPGTPA